MTRAKSLCRVDVFINTAIIKLFYEPDFIIGDEKIICCFHLHRLYKVGVEEGIDSAEEVGGRHTAFAFELQFCDFVCVISGTSGI